MRKPSKDTLLSIVAILFAILSVVQGVKLILFGSSSFLTTFVAYAAIASLATILISKGGMQGNIGLALLSLCITLFGGEVFMRFIHRGYNTYSEQHGHGYSSMYSTTYSDYLNVMRAEGRTDIHTLEFAPFELRDNTTADFSYPDYRCNARGLRGKLPEQGSRIVLTLGDSFTEGAGAPCDSTYPQLLENELRMSDSSWAVLNAGVSGNDPFFDWKMLCKLTRDISPEHVVFLLNTTDIGDVQTRGGHSRFLPDGSLSYHSAPWWEPVYAVSFISRALLQGILSYGWNLRSPEENTRTRGLALMQIQSLFTDSVAPFCMARGIRPHIAILPMGMELAGDPAEYGRLVEALSDVRAIPISDCRPHMQGSADRAALYWPTDGHCTPFGYARLAKCIAGHLSDTPDADPMPALGQSSTSL